MKTRAETFLLLSADSALERALLCALPDDATLLVADSLTDLVELSLKPNVHGAVIDGRLLVGRLDTKLERLRDKSPLLQVLFVADELSPNLINDLQPLRVDIVARPLPAKALALFVERTLSAGRLPTASVTACIDQLAFAHRLSGKEVSLFGVVLDNETPEQACQRLGLDQAVFSRTMRRLLKKCHMRSQDRLAKYVMRDALLSTRPSTASLVEPLTTSALGF